MLALKNLHQHDIQLHPFQKHPGEGRQKEEMQKGCKHRTGDLGKGTRTSVVEQTRGSTARHKTNINGYQPSNYKTGLQQNNLGKTLRV